MRIDSIPPKELLSQYIHTRNRAVEESRVSSTDQAELTSEAKTFSAALKAAREAIETRSPEQLSRMNRIAGELADGTYSVSGEDVARKIFGK